ncbi:MAG: hypothetical protein ACP5HX_10535 [Thermoproteota archaeon]
MQKIKLSKPKSIEKIIPLVLILTCIVAAMFSSDVLTLAVFIATLAVYAWRRYDSRMLVGTAILLLVVCAALLASGSEYYANEVAVWVYYFLVIGVSARYAIYCIS